MIFYKSRLLIENKNKAIILILKFICLYNSMFNLYIFKFKEQGNFQNKLIGENSGGFILKQTANSIWIKTETNEFYRFRNYENDL